MVTVSFEQQNQLAFTAWMDIRLKRAQEWENQSSATDSFQSESRMIESIAIDEEMVSTSRNESLEDITKSMQGFEDF